MGRYIEGKPGGPGRPPDTLEKKIEKKAVKQLVEEYRQTLAEALPQITPVLIRQAVKGEIQAIKEVNDRVMGKAPQDITSGGEKIEQIPIYGGLSVQGHNGNQEDIQPKQED